MSISAAELARGLERLGGVMEADGRWRVGAVVVTARRLDDLALGRLALPRYAVRLDLSALPAPERPAFVARFDAVFHRGGG
ncbi:MAG TPA: DUF1952 domain-containing protein [Thermopetrobacter sp.]|nr:DUF1952 domain-containing protein [Thermopetrobacter sp.]